MWQFMPRLYIRLNGSCSFHIYKYFIDPLHKLLLFNKKDLKKVIILVVGDGKRLVMVLMGLEKQKKKLTVACIVW